MHPNIPKPLHGMAPRTLLGDEWWADAKREAYSKASRQCMCCGAFVKDDPQYPRLEAHEVYNFDYKRGVATFSEVVAICHWCHMGIHDGLALMMFQDGKITDREYQKIRRHKERIKTLWLNELKHDQTKQYANEFVTAFIGDDGENLVPWADWALVINGVSYPAKWKSYEEWYRNYRGDTQSMFRQEMMGTWEVERD